MGICVCRNIEKEWCVVAAMTLASGEQFQDERFLVLLPGSLVCWWGQGGTRTIRVGNSLAVPTPRSTISVLYSLRIGAEEVNFSGLV